jgi:hypothetical protein
MHVKQKWMLHFRQCAPPPTGVLPQASQGLDKSSVTAMKNKTLNRQVLKRLFRTVETLLKVKNTQYFYLK